MPSCYYMPNPPYTKEARAAKFQGIVRVEGTVMLDGKIRNLRILKTPGLGLDEPVQKTLMKWKCRPAIGPDGKPVPTTVTFEVNFSLRN
jgi:periplasmic protein TonB